MFQNASKSTKNEKETYQTYTLFVILEGKRWSIYENVYFVTEMDKKWLSTLGVLTNYLNASKKYRNSFHLWKSEVKHRILKAKLFTILMRLFLFYHSKLFRLIRYFILVSLIQIFNKKFFRS